MKLTPQEVNRIFKKCLIDSSLVKPEDSIIANGIVHRAHFSKRAIEENKTTIRELLDELPDSFKQDHGGGMSFLNMCIDRHGNYWTSLHATMEELVMLGQAIGAVKYNVPAQFWPLLPGGVPYISIK